MLVVVVVLDILEKLPEQVVQVAVQQGLLDQQTDFRLLLTQAVAVDLVVVLVELADQA
tara:strand:+ start:372 stop:545 length:174 start_codon:yes stop_codon:yes gene_type:complete